jgi:hypothetical protein
VVGAAVGREVGTPPSIAPLAGHSMAYGKAAAELQARVWQPPEPAGVTVTFSTLLKALVQPLKKWVLGWGEGGE